MGVIRLTIGNSVSRIQGLGPKNFAKIRRALSYKLDRRKRFFANKTHIDRGYLINKRGDFPSGLLPIVQRMLRNIKHEIRDTRVEPKTRAYDAPSWLVQMDYEPYPEQVEAAKRAASLGRGIICMPTGTGKSVVMALLINELQVRTLVVVPSVQLKSQLSQVFRSWFGDNPNVRVENIDSSALKNLKDFDCLIIDEAHHVAAKTYRRLNRTAWAGIYHRFFFTATPFRSKTEENMIFQSVAGEVVYRLTYQDAVAKGRILPVEAYYFDVPNTVKVDSNNWRTVYSRLVVNHKDRNKALASLIERLLEAKAPFLCLVREIEHGEALMAITGVPFANGQDSLAEQRLLEFNLQEITGLIGTVGVMGEGVDTKPAEYVLLAGAGKAKTQFMQNVGRAMRLYKDQTSAKIIIPRDRSHKFLRRHFSELVRHLREEYGIKPVKLEI